MNEADFAFLQDFLLRRSGLALSREKRYLAETRLTPMLRERRFESLGELIARVRTGQDENLAREVVEAMATNETFFFRDRIPFETFRDIVLPGLRVARGPKRRLRIWCAAVSSGQEAYSLAMVLEELASHFAGWQVEILATDLSTPMIERAKAGSYSQFEVQRGLPIQLLLKYFTQDGDNWTIGKALRDKVQFRTFNLLANFSGLGPFDVIFCRNLLIYFDLPTKSSVIRRLSAELADDGFLVLGAAESVIGLTDDLVPDPSRRGLYVHRRHVAPRLVSAG